MKNINQSNVKDFASSDFVEWFRGLVDGEGHFRVYPIKDKHFGFGFEIKLHIDDLNELQFIQETLQMGKISFYKNMVCFRVGRQEDIKKIIDIFSIAPLNTSKQLNFLDFKKAEAVNKIIGDENFCAKRPENKLNPYYVTGFADAEASFITKIGPNNKLKTGWRVQPVFSICLHEKDKIILERIQEYFKVGNIHKHGETVRYNVSSPEDLAVIILNFDKYKLLTQKRADYELWKQVVELMNSKEHLTPVYKRL
jgi:hypothetical protein